jgi:CoA:oxalate CoA-transferase
VLKKLIAKADVLIHNFRPGVMEKNGFGYDAVKSMNPKMIYAEISGYGKKGPWKNKPGQDLLLQSVTGLAFTTGNGTNGPVPFGISIADILCGAQLVQGILAALIRRQKTGTGALIEVSLMESLLDFQFELFTTYFASGKLPERSKTNNGHTLLGAPYGLFQTKDGYIALAMMDIYTLAEATRCHAIKEYAKDEYFSCRDAIKQLLKSHLVMQPSAYWIERLHEYNLWAMEVFDWEKMTTHDAYKELMMEQELYTANKEAITTTRCPVRINGKRIFSSKPAPHLGEHNNKILQEIINAS